MILLFLLSVLLALTSGEGDDKGVNPTTPELISKAGYPVKTYEVTTDDGYILTHHRIPHGKENVAVANRPVVILNHGVFMSSSIWVLNGPKRSLGFILADAGYDVWLINNRGNLYSTNHTSLATSNKEFWNFSWHEMGVYDLPSTIDFIINKLHCAKIFHIGHSQGATAFYVMTSQKPEYCAKISGHISLAPAVFMSHSNNVFLNIAAQMDLARITDFITMVLGYFQILPPNFINELLGIVDANLRDVLYGEVYSIALGRGKSQLDKKGLRQFFAQFPQGGSIKQLFHYAQLKNSGTFRQFDYRELSNQQIYGNHVPPDYDLSSEIPIHVMYGGMDKISSPEDAHSLTALLPKLIKYKYIESFAHMDFVLGGEACNIVFPEIIKILSKLNGI